jgi:hypothetical protein
LGKSPTSLELFVFCVIFDLEFGFDSYTLASERDYRVMFYESDGSFMDLTFGSTQNGTNVVTNLSMRRTASFIAADGETGPDVESSHIHITKSILGWVNKASVLRFLISKKDRHLSGLCGDTVFIDVEENLDVAESESPGGIDEFLSNLKGQSPLSIVTVLKDQAERMQETVMGITIEMEKKEKERRVEMEELQKSINKQFKEGGFSVVPDDSISRAGNVRVKGKKKEPFDIDQKMETDDSFKGKIDMLTSFVASLEDPLKPKKYYDEGKEKRAEIAETYDALTIFDTPHPSYSKEDYESDLQLAHENSGILKIDDEWVIPRAPKTFSHTLIPRITCDKWLNFLIRIHVALFLLLGKSPYPPKDFMRKFNDLRRGEYSDMHSSMDLLQVVLENTIDFDGMRVKRNNFCLPILEDKMKISEMIIANCLISLLAEYKSRWAHLFKDCVIPTFVQPSDGWDIRSLNVKNLERADETQTQSNVRKRRSSRR